MGPFCVIHYRAMSFVNATAFDNVVLTNTTVIENSSFNILL